jgi:hypothetical protein
MAPRRPSLGEVVVKATVAHTVTYFLAGLLALWSFDYAHKFAEPSVRALMRQTDDPLVMAGPLFQPIRGLLFGVAFYPLRQPLFGARTGWLALWLVLVVVGILGTFGPAPGSVEGAVYTTLPLRFHLETLPEIVVQSLAFAALLWYWVNRPGRRWLTWGLGVAFAAALLLPALGLLAGRAAGQVSQAAPPSYIRPRLRAGDPRRP